jgi:hypothetical protein
MKRTQTFLRRAALGFAVAALCWGSGQGIGAQTKGTPQAEGTPQAKGTPEEQAQKMKRMTPAERKAAAARAKAARAAAAAKNDKKPANRPEDH